MGVEAISFYVVATILLVFSVLAVTSRKLLRAAIYLLFTLVGVATFYVMVDFFFLAAVQVIVYMGGIVVLIIFSVLLTSHIAEELPTVKTYSGVLSGLIAILGAFVLARVIIVGGPFPESSAGGVEADYTVKGIGTTLLSYGEGGYVLPFEVISILLLAAMVAAIVIAKRRRPPADSKQDDGAISEAQSQADKPRFADD